MRTNKTISESTKSAVGKKKEAREKSRAKIIEVSRELFALNGYSATTMEMIAKKAGFSKGLTYVYFHSKDEILEELIQIHVEREAEKIRSYMRIQDPIERINSVVDNASFSGGEQSPESLEIRIFLSLMLQPMFAEKMKGVERMLEDQIQDTQKTMLQSIRDSGFENPESEMLILRTLLTGVNILALFHGKGYDTSIIKKFIEGRYSKTK